SGACHLGAGFATLRNSAAAAFDFGPHSPSILARYHFLAANAVCAVSTAPLVRGPNWPSLRVKVANLKKRRKSCRRATSAPTLPTCSDVLGRRRLVGVFGSFLGAGGGGGVSPIGAARLAAAHVRSMCSHCAHDWPNPVDALGLASRQPLLLCQ